MSMSSSVKSPRAKPLDVSAKPIFSTPRSDRKGSPSRNPVSANEVTLELPPDPSLNSARRSLEDMKNGRSSSSDKGCADAIRQNLNMTEERFGLVRKVYVLLCIQLGVTCTFVATAAGVEIVRDFIVNNLWLLLLCCALLFLIACTIPCCYKGYRKVPLNYVVMFIYTSTESYCVAAITCVYTPMSVFSAVVATMVTVLCLSVYACYTNTDLTQWYKSLLVIFLAVVIVEAIFVFLYEDNVLFFVGSGILVIFAGMFIVVDTQVIIGGKSYELTIDDYILGVLILYSDIILLFLNILRLLGEKRN